MIAYNGMCMRKFIVILIIIFLFSKARDVQAIYDPIIVSNNHFGIHVADMSSLPEVSKLVNSNGGDWGYVTFVIQKGERDPKRWQTAMDEMRRLHLIPIVRIATAPLTGNSNVWEKPSVDEIDGWVSFLNSLNWVIKNRYVTIGNEPNHASEWGGEVNPVEYAVYLKTFSKKLKESNDNFFIMPAGLDASATNSKNTMDESLYLEKMIDTDSGLFQYIDGFASHSYPNPDFGGSGDGFGKGSVRTFVWELNYLKFLGITKDLPVFITETGWTHGTNNLTTNISVKIETAFKNAWSDKRVIAVTPFIFKYTTPPFDTFSWINQEGAPYDFYHNVLNLPKVTGTPIQEYKAQVITGIIPTIAPINSKYSGILFIKNIGQAIWSKNNINLITKDGQNIEINSMYPALIEPTQIGILLIGGVYPNSSGNYSLNIELANNGKVFNNDLKFSTNLIPNLPGLGDLFNYIKSAIFRRIVAL